MSAPPSYRLAQMALSVHKGGGNGHGGRHQRALQKSKHGALSAAAVFVSCRQNKCARTVKEVCSLIGVKENSFRKSYKVLKEGPEAACTTPSTQSSSWEGFAPHLNGTTPLNEQP